MYMNAELKKTVDTGRISGTLGKTNCVLSRRHFRTARGEEPTWVTQAESSVAWPPLWQGEAMSAQDL